MKKILRVNIITQAKTAVFPIQPIILIFSSLCMPAVTPNPLQDLPNLNQPIFYYCKYLLELDYKVRYQGSFLCKVVPIVMDCVENSIVVLLCCVVGHSTLLQLNLWVSHTSGLQTVPSQYLFIYTLAVKLFQIQNVLFPQYFTILVGMLSLNM